MGLAVYNSIILDIHFPPCCFKKLLSPAVVPYNNPQAMVGVTTMSIEDLKTVQPVSLYNNVRSGNLNEEDALFIHNLRAIDFVWILW